MQREGSTHDRSQGGHGQDHDEGQSHTDYRGAERGTEQSGSQGRRYGSQRSEENPMYGGRAGYGQHDDHDHQAGQGDRGDRYQSEYGQQRQQGSGQGSGQGSQWGYGDGSRSAYGQGSQGGYGRSGEHQQSGDAQQGRQYGNQQGRQHSGQQGYQYGEETVGPGDYGQGARRPESDTDQRSTGYGRSDTGATGYGQPRHAQTLGERRIRGVFSGKAPKGYNRSDERIEEDINERLMHDPDIDPSDIEVKVEKGQVTLTGTVDSRHDKFEVEELIDHIMGVKDVNNHIKVKKRSASDSDPGSSPSALSTGGATASGSTAGGTTTGSRSSSGESTSSKRGSSR